MNTSNQTKNFSDFNIVAESNTFIGPKIDMQDIVDQEIIVYGYVLGPSQHPEKGNPILLTMQIVFEEKKRVVFSGSAYLQQMIQKVPAEGFPFRAIIKRDRDSKRLEFKGVAI